MRCRYPFDHFVGGLLLLCTALGAQSAPAEPPCPFDRDFAPTESLVNRYERPFREAVCLNGRWQFQPVPVPEGFRPNQGRPPELPPPASDAWDAVPIKIPSPWNVNTWGCGRAVGAGTPHPLWPNSIYYPSYPAAWDAVKMGWLRRSFRVPDDWKNKRLLLHFEAVAGECRVLVNGQEAGEHFDKYVPFDLNVSRLVRRDQENELLVGVRDHRLFNKASGKYPKMIAPYPCGSNTDSLVGIWQDVYLVGLPAVRVDDAFVKPLVDEDLLELEIALRNDSQQEQHVTLDGSIRPWVNMAGKDVLSGPEPNYRLDSPALTLSPRTVELAARSQTVIRLRQAVQGRLKAWTPDAPNLYVAALRLSQRGTQLDSRTTRFGWRQLKIRGRDLLLNGQKIQLAGDLVHPFGPCAMSRRTVWAWYTMVKDLGGNAIRPHAQVHPRIYLDLADEMGLLVLDETALFGSSCQLNFEEPEAWRRFERHYDALVLRDRNHPSVLGWSFGNELFAIFHLNQVSKEDADRWYDRLAELGLRARGLDSTRDWISCDGDEDLRGKLPVWSKHFGHGLPLDRLPEIDKPLMVGESGGTYYARPKDLAVFNGPRAYESYQGRNEALAIDVYENLVRMARPRLAYFSASETVWFGLEHLPLGYRDFDRLPGDQDGVLFTRPYEDGRPGMQPERLPPYVTTLNPGWDPALPLYRPLAMFYAEKAALAKEGPQPCPWRRPAQAPASKAALPPPSLDQVAFIGDRASRLAGRLGDLGVPLGSESQAPSPRSFMIIDADALRTESYLAEAEQALRAAGDRGGVAMLMFAVERTVPEAARRLLPATVRLTDRPATALVPAAAHPWVSSFTLPRLHFAEDGADRTIMKRGIELSGPLAQRAQVLLRASNTDWSVFNDAGENAKCAALVLDEQLHKPAGACLVACEHGRGKLVLSSIDYRITSPAADALWRDLFANMGIKLRRPQKTGLQAFDEDHVLINALGAGRFGAEDVAAALSKDFIGEKTVRPRAGVAAADRKWAAVTCPSKDRFLFHQLQQSGPEKAFAVYFSFWVRSPRALDDLLAGGPDMPHAGLACYVSRQCRLYLNGVEAPPARSEAADYRTLLTFENLPLHKGWNHCLLKVVADQLEGEQPATLAARIHSDNADYLRQLDSALDLEPEQSK